MAIKKLPFEEFKQIYARVPRLAVDLVIKKGNKIILSKRAIPPAVGKWHMPGGTILLGETPEDAINRVSKEEAGIEVDIKKLLGAQSYFLNTFGNEAYGQTIGYVYLVEYRSGRVKRNEQGSEIKLFSSLPENTVEEQVEFINSHKEEIFN